MTGCPTAKLPKIMGTGLASQNGRSMSSSGEWILTIPRKQTMFVVMATGTSVVCRLRLQDGDVSGSSQG